MKTLLRSCFKADKADKPELLLRNVLLLQQAALPFEEDEDVVLWDFVLSFVRQYNHAPDVATIQGAMKARRENEVLDRLESIRTLPVRQEGDFKTHLNLKAEERRTRRMTDILTQAATILSSGLEVQEGPSKKDRVKLLGPQDAVKYVLGRGHEIITPTFGSKLSGEVTGDGVDFMSEYERVETDPTSGVGQHTGLAQMDSVLNGAKRAELWLHTAFTGGMKCVTGGTRIWDMLTGALRTVGEVYESRWLPEVYGLNESDGSLVPAKADAIAKSGVRPIVRLESEKGRSTRVSANHPFWTPNRWVDAGNLRPGDWVGVAESLPDDCHVRWERLTSVEPDGEEMTYDLSVPGNRSFVADGFVTHNSTFALNWVYNQAIYALHDSLFFSLEMPYQQVRRILVAMHSFHEKFRDVRYKMGLQKTPGAMLGLPYDAIRDGKLPRHHARAKEFLKIVVDDLKNPTNDYGKIRIEVADPDKSDFTVADMRQKAELLYSKHPFSMIVMDHAGLMAPRKWVTSTTERLNEVLRDLKRTSMSFNRGAGMAVVALFQINRDGYKTALKRKEKTGQASYDLTALSYANEAERCLMISSTYVQTLKGTLNIGDVQVGGRVWSSTGWCEVENRFLNGVRRIWKTTTDRGSHLLTTASHRLRVIEDGCLGWKAVQSLTPADYVAGAFGGKCWPDSSPILPRLDVRKGEKRYGKRGVEITTPGRVPKALAYLLGAWDGDGKVHSGGIAWTGNRSETDVRRRIQESFMASFAHPLPCHESPSRPGSFDLVKWSRPLKRWFEGVAGQRAGEVPECILRSPRNIVCAYLQGLFDTDGWVNNQGVVGINLEGACEPFLRDVQMLLTSMGIDSHLSFGSDFLKKTGKRYPKVILRIRSRAGREQFAQDIGFTEAPKREMLAMFVLGDKKGRKSDKQVYPVPRTFMAVYEQCGKVPERLWHLPSKVKATGLVPRGPVEMLVEHATGNGVESKELDFLKELLTLQVMRVASVEDTGMDEEVIDLEVGGDHEYQTGPVLSHNSSDIVTASWVDDDLVKANRVQFQCLKSRDNAKFEMFLARVEWPCRRLITCTELVMSPQDKQAVGEELDKMDL